MVLQTAEDALIPDPGLAFPVGGDIGGICHSGDVGEEEIELGEREDISFAVAGACQRLLSVADASPLRIFFTHFGHAEEL